MPRLAQRRPFVAHRLRRQHPPARRRDQLRIHEPGVRLSGQQADDYAHHDDRGHPHRRDPVIREAEEGEYWGFVGVYLRKEVLRMGLRSCRTKMDWGWLYKLLINPVKW